MSFTALKAKKGKTKSYVAVPPSTRDSSSAANPSERDPGEHRNGAEEQLRVTESQTSPSQASNQGMHSSLPPWLQIRVSNEEGRGLWATQPIRAGSTILSVKPYSHAISNRYLDTCCSACSASTDAPATASSPKKLSRCAKCRVVWYCDSTCQTNDWSIHKHECSALQRWFQAAASSPIPEDAMQSGSSEDAMEFTVRPPSDAIRCMARMLWMKQKKGANSSWAKEIDGMQSHRATLTNIKGNTKIIEEQTQLAHSLVQYLGVASPQDLSSQFGIQSAGELVDIISKFTTNTFTLADPSLTPIGACVSPTAALLNHSCDPNTVVVFPGATSDENKKSEPRMEVVALKNIMPGEEVFTAYIDTTLPRSLRQKALKETYHFTCRCSLCAGSNDPADKMDVDDGVASSDLGSPDPRQAIWCPRKCGGTCSLPDIESEDTTTQSTSCFKCKTPIPKSTFEEVLDAVRIGKEGLDKATKMQYTDPEKGKRLTTNLIPILMSVGLSHSSYPLLAMMRLHQAFLIDELPILMQGIQSVASTTREETLVSPAAKEHAQRAQVHLDDAIRTATEVVTGLTGVLHPAHPVLGVALAELGRLLAVDEVAAPEGTDASSNSPTTVYPPSGPARLKLAYDTHVRALSILKIGFGTKNDGGNVGKAVREDIVRLEKEIEVWKTGVKNVLRDRA
ncbi:hypothetical protein VNI00_012318 [Paramarasmius palmivorus]|uniref:SET domain-containing protein n=1 Tax=Paramarasmius palmivorus TaxID=297713 RepID=A0AAW0C6T4_9AGAR